MFKKGKKMFLKFKKNGPIWSKGIKKKIYPKNLQKPQKNLQKHPRAPQNLQTPQKASKSLQRSPNPLKAFKSLQKPSKSSKNLKSLQKPSKSSRSLQMSLNTYKRVQKALIKTKVTVYGQRSVPLGAY